MTTKFAFLAYPFLLLAWFVAGTRSYAATTSDSGRSAIFMIRLIGPYGSARFDSSRPVYLRLRSLTALPR